MADLKETSKKDTRVLSTIHKTLNKLPNHLHLLDSDDIENADIDVLYPIEAEDLVEKFSDEERKSLMKSNAVLEWRRTHPKAAPGETQFGIAYFDKKDLNVAKKSKENALNLDFHAYLYKTYWKPDDPAMRKYITELFPSLRDMQLKAVNNRLDALKDHIRVNVVGDIQSQSDLMKKYLSDNGLINAASFSMDGSFDIINPRAPNKGVDRHSLMNAQVGRENRVLSGAIASHDEPLVQVRATKQKAKLNAGDEVARGRRKHLLSRFVKPANSKLNIMEVTKAIVEGDAF
jgi:hypothetical protein